MATESNPDEAERPVIMWFRDDLRLSDNPALYAAAELGRPLLCVFVHDEESAGVRPLGGAARWWLHGALQALSSDLEHHGGRLLIFRGSALQIIPAIAASCGAGTVLWNRRYGAAERRVDEVIKTGLNARHIEAKSFNGHLLYEPWTIKSRAGEPFRVFSAFWRAARLRGEPELPLVTPSGLSSFKYREGSEPSPVKLYDLALEPSSPDWANGLRVSWQRGEAGAQACLERFLDTVISSYADFRDYPDRASTSRLSPYLRFGNISARQVWHAAAAVANPFQHDIASRNLEKFQSELGWREFSYHLLYHNPDIASQNFHPKFEAMPWRSDPVALKAWQQGRTGYPIVDAGMRELWNTGWMHNRVRMVVASFLVKHLLIDWRQGEAWFWDTLVDADPANNAASWQWVAGSGADAAPHFRIFNPVLQGEKFDPEGNYVRHWVPELAEVPISFMHSPWRQVTGPSVQKPEYALPYADRIVAHDDARRRALKAYKGLV